MCAHLSREKYKEAAAALLRGFEKGQLQHPDQARVDLGIAYCFSEIKADSEWRDLAEL